MPKGKFNSQQQQQKNDTIGSNLDSIRNPNQQHTTLRQGSNLQILLNPLHPTTPSSPSRQIEPTTITSPLLQEKNNSLSKENVDNHDKALSDQIPRNLNSTTSPINIDNETSASSSSMMSSNVSKDDAADTSKNLSKPQQKKRRRKKFHDVERYFFCDYPNCGKSYGSLTHLNEHRVIQRHGARKKLEDFSEVKKIIEYNKLQKSILRHETIILNAPEDNEFYNQQNLPYLVHQPQIYSPYPYNNVPNNQDPRNFYHLQQQQQQPYFQHPNNSYQQQQYQIPPQYLSQNFPPPPSQIPSATSSTSSIPTLNNISNLPPSNYSSSNIQLPSIRSNLLKIEQEDAEENDNSSGFKNERI